MKMLAGLFLSGLILTGCGPSPSSDSAAAKYDELLQKSEEQLQTDAKHQMLYEEQAKKAEEQLKMSQQQLEKQEQQSARFEKLLEKWEEQAKRYDAILAAWEKQKPPQQ
jgi:hypothetical protein